MQYHSFTQIWVRIVFLFHSFKGNFFYLQEQWRFSTVNAVNDCIFDQTYRFPYLPRVWPLVQIAVTIGNSIPSLRIFAILRVAGWQGDRVAGCQLFMRRPPWMRIQNGPPFIIDLLYLGGGSRGGVFHKCSNKYTPPPKTAPDQGIQNRYFPHRSRRDVGARSCPSDPWLRGGGWGVVS